MSRKYSDPVCVQTQCQRPWQFHWRGRDYTVRGVVEHWVALPRDWYPTARTALPRREHWRVRASSGHGHGVYELCFLSDTEQWYLERVWD